jgi:hypothetical protein
LARLETRNLIFFPARQKEASPVPIISECCEPGCVTLTIGDYCIEHERTATADEPLLREVATGTVRYETTRDDGRRAASLRGPA